MDVDGKQKYELLKHSGDYIIALDVCSLYPTAMTGTDYLRVNFPVGHHRMTSDPETAYKQGKLGIYEI